MTRERGVKRNRGDRVQRTKRVGDGSKNSSCIGGGVTAGVGGVVGVEEGVFN